MRASLRGIRFTKLSNSLLEKPSNTAATCTPASETAHDFFPDYPFHSVNSFIGAP